MPVQTWGLTPTGWKNDQAVTTLTDRDFLVYGEYEPDATTTGTVPGIPLTTYVGDITTSADNEVIENLDIYGQVTVNHENVIVRNCRIRGSQNYPTSGTPTTPSVQMWQTSAGTTLVIDCEISGGATGPNPPADPPADITPNLPYGGNVRASYGPGGTHIRIERCNIYGTVDGSQSNYGGNTYLGNYIHDLPWFAWDSHQTDGSHNDGIQGIGSDGRTTRATLIRGNSFSLGLNGTSGILFTQPAGTQVHELTIDKNWFRSTVPRTGIPERVELPNEATATAINLAQKQIPTGFTGPVTVTNNRIQAWNGSEGGNNHGWKTDHDGLIDQQTYDAATISNNTWLDGVTPAKITRITVT